MEVVNFGIIGLGAIGTLHLRNIVTYGIGKVVAVADKVEERARFVGKEWGVPKVHTNYFNILEDPDVDAVLICTPASTHPQIISEAAEARKHIFCEKPLGLDLEEIDKALEVVKQAKVKLQVGFNRRFDPNFRRIKELVAAGTIGEPCILRITSRDPDIPSTEYLRVCGGLFFDTTIHDFDMARFLMNDEIEELYACGAVLIEPRVGEVGDIDTATIFLRFRRGALGTIDNARRAVYGYDQRVEILGTKGMLCVDNRIRDLVIIKDYSGTHTAPNVNFFPDRYPEAFVNELKEFVRSILDDTEPPVTGEDGRKAVVAAYAARLSMKQNKPIPLAQFMKKGGVKE